MPHEKLKNAIPDAFEPYLPAPEKSKHHGGPNRFKARASEGDVLLNSTYRLLLCTCPDRDTALRLAERLVNERLAACVSLLPNITSVYRWKEAIAQDDEVLLLIKTGLDRVESLIDDLTLLHPYDVPEIIAVPITEGLTDYLSWITTCTREPE